MASAPSTLLPLRQRNPALILVQHPHHTLRIARRPAIRACFSTSAVRERMPMTPKAREAKTQNQYRFAFRSMLTSGMVKTTKAAIRDTQAKGLLPNDLGLMAGTLVMPTGARRPGVFSKPGLVLAMELGRAWKRIRDFAGVIAYKTYDGRPWRKISFFKTRGVAKDLHQQMYEALAAGDTKALQELCCEGLHDRLGAQISMRTKGYTYKWTLHKYIGMGRVVSHRGTAIPLTDPTGRKPMLRQAVVKLKSKQSLEVRDRHGVEVVEESIRDQEVTEYVVIQRRVFRGKEENWRVWGTTEESRIESRKGLEEVLNPEIRETAVAT